ncbi:Uncharacterised protein [Mycobacterium tuberculosis]|uniref:Uncharacterized protein n=1 Tax=Mycobacterium tuberculosis TaxID=1773 RepID=A0A916PCF4_MYCTX|nr:Uncharacterised protein [Mycobacterium tuberculosis]
MPAVLAPLVRTPYMIAAVIADTSARATTMPISSRLCRRFG